MIMRQLFEVLNIDRIKVSYPCKENLIMKLTKNKKILNTFVV